MQARGAGASPCLPEARIGVSRYTSALRWRPRRRRLLLFDSSKVLGYILSPKNCHDYYIFAHNAIKNAFSPVDAVPKFRIIFKNGMRFWKCYQALKMSMKCCDIFISCGLAPIFATIQPHPIQIFVGFWSDFIICHFGGLSP